MNRKKTKRELWYYLSKFLKQISVVPFLIGIFINCDGVLILLNKDEYKTGKVLVDEINSTPTGSSSEGAVSFNGTVIGDTVITGTIFNPSDWDSISAKRNEEKLWLKDEEEVLIMPVWYHPSGKRTLNRARHEDEFPVNRIRWKLLKYILLLNGPILYFWLLSRYLKKKYKIND